MMNDDWDGMISALKHSGIEFDCGLTDEEIARAETNYELRFPPDLRSFLLTALPIGQRFPNWRSVDDSHIREALDWPLEGILFDVQHGVWLTEWGARPRTFQEAKEIVETHVKAAPRLIPIMGHRYLPAVPPESGNPILSVQQFDIIVYGHDLRNYFDNEFLHASEGILNVDFSKVRTIPAWTGYMNCDTYVKLEPFAAAFS